MAYSEDHIALAAEYALGTLDAGERAQVQTMMAVDTGFAALCEAWVLRLSVLNQMVGLVEPRAELWERIKAAIAGPAACATEPASEPDVVAPDTEIVAPPPASEIPLPPDQASAPAVEPPGEPLGAVVQRDDATPAGNAEVIRLTARVRQWRTVANAMTALAAALLAIISVEVYRPDLLPQVLRPKPRVQEVAASKAPPAQFVALLQKDGETPAFILTVDAAAKSFTVRRVGAEPEQGKSYELWLVSDKFPAPRSLGVIGGQDFTTRPGLSSYDADTVNGATYAVSLEPEGGSPTGEVTGPIVFSGKLIETVPAAETTPH